MSLIATSNPVSSFEHVYDRHSSGLYGIILKMTHNTKEAEDILLQSFKTFFKENVTGADDSCVFLHLIRISIHLAAKKMNSTKYDICKVILNELRQSTCS